MHPLRHRGRGDAHADVEGSGVDHRPAPFQLRGERIGVADVQHAGLHARELRAHALDRRRVAVGDRHRVVSAAGEQVGDHRADLARTDDEHVPHGALPACGLAGFR